MDKIIFIGSLIGMLGMGTALTAPPVFRFVKSRVKAMKTVDPIAPVLPEVIADPFPSGSDQRPPKAVTEYLQALKAACPSASLDILFSMALAGCSLFEAAKNENARLLKLSQGEAK